MCILSSVVKNKICDSFDKIVLQWIVLHAANHLYSFNLILINMQKCRLWTDKAARHCPSLFCELKLIILHLHIVNWLMYCTCHRQPVHWITIPSLCTNQCRFNSNDFNTRCKSKFPIVSYFCIFCVILWKTRFVNVFWASWGAGNSPRPVNNDDRIKHAISG